MPDKSPLVTLYITNHNYGEFIDTAVRSVLQQTLQDFELLIIDDGSTDGSRELIAQYEEPGRVTTILQQNRGLNVTNNIALHAARGKYIMRLDADDYLDGNALAVLSDVLERYPDVGLVFPDYYRVDREGSVIEVVRRHDFDTVTLLDQPAHGACTLIRRRCLLEIGGYDETFRAQDGYDLWIQAIRRYQVKNVNLPLFYYRQHESSLTRNEDLILGTRAQIVRKHAGTLGREMEAIAVIPVRGPSYDPGSMALRPLGGRPLLDWTVDAALTARRLTGIVVTSPDQRIIDHVGRTYGDRVLAFRREPELARINTEIENTLLSSAARYAQIRRHPQAVALLYIESPFRTGEEIDSAVETMSLFETDSVVAVRPDRSVLYQHHGDGMKPIRQTHSLRLERDDLFRQVGHLRIIDTDFLGSGQRLDAGKTGHIVIGRTSAFSVTSEWDWEIAEHLAQRSMARSPS